MVKRGARITVLTNSLAATDVGAVHAGSQRYRKPLLEAGVRLYEVKPDAIEYARCETNETKAVPHWNLPDASVH
jgi:putative cardiolipin synthase